MSRSSVNLWVPNQFMVSKQSLCHLYRGQGPGNSWTTQGVTDLSTAVHTGTALIPSYNYRDRTNWSFVFITRIPYSFSKKQSQILAATVKFVFYRVALRDPYFPENSSVTSETMEGLIQRFSISNVCDTILQKRKQDLVLQSRKCTLTAWLVVVKLLLDILYGQAPLDIK